MYEYRLYPSKVQQKRLFSHFNLCCELYNILLKRCKDAYKEDKTALNSKTKLSEMVKEIKDNDPRFKEVHSQVLQNCVDRLSKAYANFFRRLKEKQSGKKIKVGFPRFKKQFKSITYPQSGFKFISDKKLRVSKIGGIPIVLHRVPKGKVKTMTIKRNKAGQWFAVFACEVESPVGTHSTTDKAVGIDVGIESFATLSTGEHIPNPRYLVKSEKKLKKAHRGVSGKVKGSKNRGKAIYRLAKVHVKVANQRRDFQHKLSGIITNEFGTIAVEDLRINNMLKNHHLAKHISDASWNSFIQMLCYKAESANGRVLKNSKTKGSSIRCSNCGKDVPKPLSVRVHNCPFCGFTTHRDHNSALNHLKDTVGLTEIYACGDSTPTSILQRLVASGVVEAGTTFGSTQFH